MHSFVHIFSISFLYLQYCLPSARVHNRQLAAALPVNELVVDKELQICSSHIFQCKAESQYHGSSSSPFSAEPALQRALQHTCFLHPDLHAVPDIGWLYMHLKQAGSQSTVLSTEQSCLTAAEAVQAGTARPKPDHLRSESTWRVSLFLESTERWFFVPRADFTVRRRLDASYSAACTYASVQHLQ